MSNQKEFNEVNEQDLEQVSGGMSHDSASFRCPVCGYQQSQFKTVCEIGEEGSLCPQCMSIWNQRVNMIRIR